MRADETAGIFSWVEAQDIFMWPRAEHYRIIGGTIYADGKRREEDGHPRRLNLDRRSPLSDPQLFQSFARLASHNGPSDNRIKKWVHEHGLLHRKDPNLGGDAFMPDGGVNQAPMTVWTFRGEVHHLRGLLDLYLQIRAEQTATIKERGANPTSDIDKELALGLGKEAPYVSHDEQLTPQRKNLLSALIMSPLSRAPNPVLYHADKVLCRLLSEKLGGIRPRLASGFTPPEEKGVPITAPPNPYRLHASWSCSDLLGAMYLQFYLWVSRNQPVRICENKSCRMPFPLTRKDKKFCNDSCARGALYHRSKKAVNNASI